MDLRMINRTNDMNAVAQIFNHPKVYGWVSDDMSPRPYIPSPSHCYLLDDSKAAVARVDELNGVTCMVHIATLHEMRGQTASFAKDGIAWVFKNTTFSKIISLAPEVV